MYRLILSTGEAGEAEPVGNRDRGQATDGDLMDGEAEGDTVVIAGQPEVLSTQAMQVICAADCNTVFSTFENPLILTSVSYSYMLVGGE